ncbi:MAG: hypothetical protein PHI84_01380 [Kiritimatiellae bacterium]|nr:hypothetical protein [Kiritimatiellia bacterium]
MEKDYGVDTLLFEYKEMKQENRDLITSMTTNFNIGTVAVTSAVGLAITKDEYIFTLVPTLLFMFSTIHLIKCVASNINSTYCQVIQNLLKSKLGEGNILMDWEGGMSWENSTQPSSVLQFGFYMFFVPIIVLFVFCTWKTFMICPWSLLIHGLELIIVSIYAFRVMKWGSQSHRSKVIEKYMAERYPKLVSAKADNTSPVKT